MLTPKSGELKIGSTADDFIKYFTKKKTHVSFFYDAEELRFEIKPEDEAERKVNMIILGTLISKGYEMVEARFTVTPSEEDITTSCLEYTFKFDKINNDCIQKKEIVEAVLTYIKICDRNNTNGDNFKYNSFVAGYPAQECFDRYIREFSDHDDVSMGKVISRQKRIFTVSFINAPNMMDDDEYMFESIQVTITITPKKDDNNRSRVKWTIKVENADDYGVEQSDRFLETADYIRETIMFAIKTFE